MQDYDLGDEAADGHSWKSHDWTGEEAHFVAQILQHGDVARAYSTAYREEGKRIYKPQAMAAGEEIMQQPHIRDYIQFIRDKIKAKLAMADENIMDEIRAMAFSNMADFVVLSEDGTPQTDLSGLTREQWAAVQEVTIDTYMDGKGEGAERVRSVKIKTLPKVQAMTLLAKTKRMFFEDNSANADRGPEKIEVVYEPPSEEPPEGYDSE